MSRPFAEPAEAEVARVLEAARGREINEALFDDQRERVRRGAIPPEDDRLADWRFFLPIAAHHTALLIGSGWGTLPLAFAPMCQTLYVLDSSREKIALLGERQKARGIDNIVPVLQDERADLPWTGPRFDQIIVGPFASGVRPAGSFRAFLRGIASLLKEGGTFSLVAGNRWALDRFMARQRPGTLFPLHSLGGYRRAFQREGFSAPEIYAPLPRHDGIPMFYIPLHDSRAVAYFLTHIFPLFEAVSPEVKKSYALEYALAKQGVRLTLRLGAAPWIRNFVPGFMMIAVKGRRL